MEFDRDLVSQAQRFIDGANVHYVKTWIYCYEVSLPNSLCAARTIALQDARNPVFAEIRFSRLRLPDLCQFPDLCP